MIEFYLWCLFTYGIILTVFLVLAKYYDPYVGEYKKLRECVTVGFVCWFIALSLIPIVNIIVLAFTITLFYDMCVYTPSLKRFFKQQIFKGEIRAK